MYASNVEEKDRKDITEFMPLDGDKKIRKTNRLMNRKQWDYMNTHWN